MIEAIVALGLLLSVEVGRGDHFKPDAFFVRPWAPEFDWLAVLVAQDVGVTNFDSGDKENPSTIDQRKLLRRESGVFSANFDFFNRTARHGIEESRNDRPFEAGAIEASSYRYSDLNALGRGMTIIGNGHPERRDEIPVYHGRGTVHEHMGAKLLSGHSKIDFVRSDCGVGCSLALRKLGGKSVSLQSGIGPGGFYGGLRHREVFVIRISAPLGFLSGGLGPMGRAPCEEGCYAREAHTEEPQDKLGEPIDALDFSYAIRALPNAVRDTIDSKGFPLVLREVLVAAILGLGGCWGGLWGALWLAGWRDRRRTNQEKR